ncbi:ThiF family adenylyltransferase [Streptomyces sp. N2-109]|uniref:ThiF family adenylyltransferase n=1 Tax=Streptomyces gossypii TaxID=2883101 RepID=A0ABT2JPA4_9ACTN|nr:ThiF family adenylyltransferase [Streptomyces gossypii]MCT2589708.1 ThiF family adenylyltransferase [Streptomyces gossypii]
MIFGIGAEVRDPEGWIWTLTEAMDGFRSPGEVVTTVLARHSGLAREEVLQAMDDLLQAGFVEDAAVPLPSGLTERERTRYGRGVALLRWMDLAPRASAWELQLRLRESRVLLVGVGGTGGVVAQSLVASGIGALHCVDPDVVELSNLNRQLLFQEADIGLPKVEAAVARLRMLNSDVTVTGERFCVRGADDLAALLSPGYDLLALCADRPPEIRGWANAACLKADLPWAEGGYRGPLVSVGVHVPGRGACWECHRAGEIERRDLRLGPDQDEEAASPRMPWNPVNAVTAGLSGSLLAHAALALITGAPPMEPGYRLGFNLMVPGEPVTERFSRRPDCPACGGW